MPRTFLFDVGCRMRLQMGEEETRIGEAESWEFRTHGRNDVVFPGHQNVRRSYDQQSECNGRCGKGVRCVCSCGGEGSKDFEDPGLDRPGTSRARRDQGDAELAPNPKRGLRLIWTFGSGTPCVFVGGEIVARFRQWPQWILVCVASVGRVLFGRWEARRALADGSGPQRRCFS